jgi:hypothetical protein
MKESDPPNESLLDMAPEARPMATSREEHRSPALASSTPSPRGSDHHSEHGGTADPGQGEAVRMLTFDLGPDAVSALREFLELLDKWDREGANEAVDRTEGLDIRVQNDRRALAARSRLSGSSVEK